MSALHILLPTDLSHAASVALQFGGAYARRVGARVTVLHADRSFGAEALIEHPLGYYFENLPQRLIEFRGILADHARRNGIEVEWPDLVVVQNDPVQAILEAARSRSVDLIIMGSHGRGGWRRRIRGSVAERVVRQARCPVLTIGPNSIAAPMPDLDVAATLAGAR